MRGFGTRRRARRRGGGVTQAARLALNAPLVLLGNSKNAAAGALNYAAIALVLAGGRYYSSPFWRVSRAGDRVDDYRARLVSHCLPLLRANGNAGGMLVIGDATNDYGVAGRSTTAIVADYRWMAEQVFAAHAGHMVVIELTPRYTTLSAAGETDRQAGNAALAAMTAEPAWQGRLRLSDQSALGTYLATSESADGKHYTTAKLARRAADVLAAVLVASIDAAPLLSAASEPLVTGGFGANIHSNWQLADTAPDDQVVDGFTASTTSGAAVTFAATSGTQTMVKVGSATNAGANDQLLRNIAVAPQPMGRMYESIVAVSHTASVGGGSLALTTSDTIGMPGSGVIAGAGAFQPLAGVLRAASPPIQPNGVNLTNANVSTALVTREAVGATDTGITVSAPWIVREIEMDAYAAPVDLGQPVIRPSDGSAAQLFTAFAIANNAGTLTAIRANVAGGGWFKAGGSISYQWEVDTGGGFASVGANQRTFAPGGASGAYRCRTTYANPLGNVTITSNTLVL